MIQSRFHKKRRGELDYLAVTGREFPVRVMTHDGTPSRTRWLFALLLIACQLYQAIAGELSDKLVSDLANGEFRIREKAQSELLAQSRQKPERAMDELFRLSRSSGDPEIRLRCVAILRDLLKDQYMKEGQGFVGIGRLDKTVDIAGRTGPCHGVLVTSVRNGTPAERSGIRVGDLIISLNGGEWKQGIASETFADQIAAMRPGTKVTLAIYRDDKKIDVDLVLVRRPAGLPMEFMLGQTFDPEKAENDALEAFFRDWFAERGVRN